MNVRYIERDRLLFFDLTEEIDHHTTEEIRRKADYEIERCMPKRVIFNFNSVNFMDSSGIGMLLGRYKIVKMVGGEVGIINVKNNVKKILEMCGILKIIPIYETVNLGGTLNE